MTTTTKTKCGEAHHWKIDPPNGRYSKGVCQKCGAEREFDNAPPVDPLHKPHVSGFNNESLIDANVRVYSKGLI